MTKREFLQAVITSDGVAENIKEYAQNEIVKMDERNANRSSKPTKKQLENESIKAEVIEVLTDEPQTAKEIAGKLEGKYTVNKISAICKLLEKDELVEKKEGKVNKYLKK